MLPTTLRRLVEAVTVGAIGPLVEPTLSAWQAARHGGTCRQNINLAVQHLEGRRTSHPDRSDREGQPNPGLSAALLGP
eukprot:10440023-Alexandrium_andersonii.AAC.1